MDRYAPRSEDELAEAVKAMRDMDALIELVMKNLTRAKLPWQRVLAAHLANIDRMLQVLRMTVNMERPDDEILAAATDLRTACRKAELALGGSRADVPTRASMRLISDLANRVGTVIGEYVRSAVG